jgi:hypothetical protein
MLLMVLSALVYFGGAFGPAVSVASANQRRAAVDEDNNRAWGKKIRLPVTIHIATRRGDEVVSRTRIRKALREANATLAPYGIEVWVKRVKVMPRGYSRVTGTPSRVRLARRTEKDGSIHVFFVDRVQLERNHRVSGMHWRYHGLRKNLRKREYIVVAHDAPSTTFTHEIGHAFGLGHHRSTDNLMCSCRREAHPRFTRTQGLRLRGGARRLLQRAG